MSGGERVIVVGGDWIFAWAVGGCWAFCCGVSGVVYGVRCRLSIWKLLCLLGTRVVFVYGVYQGSLVILGRVSRVSAGTAECGGSLGCIGFGWGCAVIC